MNKAEQIGKFTRLLADYGFECAGEHAPACADDPILAKRDAVVAKVLQGETPHIQTAGATQ